MDSAEKETPSQKKRKVSRRKRSNRYMHRQVRAKTAPTTRKRRRTKTPSHSKKRPQTADLLRRKRKTKKKKELNTRTRLRIDISARRYKPSSLEYAAQPIWQCSRSDMRHRKKAFRDIHRTWTLRNIPKHCRTSINTMTFGNRANSKKSRQSHGHGPVVRSVVFQSNNPDNAEMAVRGDSVFIAIETRSIIKRPTVTIYPNSSSHAKHLPVFEAKSTAKKWVGTVQLQSPNYPVGGIDFLIHVTDARGNVKLITETTNGKGVTFCKPDERRKTTISSSAKSMMSQLGMELGGLIGEFENEDLPLRNRERANTVFIPSSYLTR